MKQEIYPCLWFNGNAREAAEYYCSVFKDARITDDNPIVTMFRVSGQRIMCLNGGPEFSFNPSVSFFVVCETEDELNKAWTNLLSRGSVLMALDKYPWSEKYGWLQDRYGVSWQLSLGKIEEVGQKITPSLLFTGKQNGKAEKAVNYYTSIFKNSSIKGILRWEAGENEVPGNVKHAQFRIGNNVFMAMDSSFDHKFGFNEAISFVVECEDQKEIDYFWYQLTENGEEGQCGWLKDQFGVSWQIIPAILSDLMSEPEKSQRVINAFMQMRKFEIEKLVNA